MTLERVDTLPILPKRPADGHKGLYGSVLVVAGGRGMAGRGRFGRCLGTPLGGGLGAGRECGGGPADGRELWNPAT